MDCKGQRSKSWAYTGSSAHLSVCDKCVCSCPVCLSVSLSLSLSEVTKGQSLTNSHVLITHFQTSPCVFFLSFSTREPAPGLRQVPDNLNPCPLVAVCRGSVKGVLASPSSPPIDSVWHYLRERCTNLLCVFNTSVATWTGAPTAAGRPKLF